MEDLALSLQCGFASGSKGNPISSDEQPRNQPHQRQQKVLP
jgi:hypothetical protein